jgi:predicted nuclease of predicted toxin-antitoxin system
MKFLLDHDVPADLAAALRTVGHEVVRSVEVLLATASDEEVWAHGCVHGLIVVTCNRNDYLALAAATDAHPGLILLNRRRTRQAETSHFLTLVRKAGEQGLANNINFA